MAYEYNHSRRIEFAETDLVGVVHFSRYARFAEEAEHAFFRSLGLSVYTPCGDYSLGFPRLASRLEFFGPLRFEDVIDVHLWVRRRGRKSITFQFRLTHEGQVVAQGEVVAACCRCYPDGHFETCELTKEFLDVIEEAPLEPLKFRAAP